MSLVFTERSLEPERMDLESLAPATTTRILKALESINAWLGGVRATLFHVERFSKKWPPGSRVRFLDWGTGGADVPRAIVRWCRLKGFKAEIVGMDNNPAVVDYAREACEKYPEIQIVNTDVTLSVGRDEDFDYVLSSLTLHHLSNDQIVALLKRSDQIAKRGIIMNDLKRSVRAWAWIWALTRLTRADPIVCNDGPLSVKRAFTKRELAELAQRAGVPYLKVETHFGYRFTLAGEKVE